MSHIILSRDMDEILRYAMMVILPLQLASQHKNIVPKLMSIETKYHMFCHHNHYNLHKHDNF